MTNQVAAVFITKIEVARRQLNAAIRMHFMNMDELAVHTVAGAVLNLAKDLADKRGIKSAESANKLGFFEFLRDLALDKLPERTKNLAWVKKLASELTQDHLNFLRSPNATIEQFHVAAPDTKKFWSDTKASFNQLKHADRNPGPIKIDEINNLELLSKCLGVYSDLGLAFDYEMHVFTLYSHASLSLRDFPWDKKEDEKTVEALRAMDDAMRRSACLAIIESID